jgi:hypothetical protein
MFDVYPVSVSQTLIVLSREAETIQSPFGVKRTELTVCSCPWRVFKQLRASKSHIFNVKSLEHET